MRKTLYFQIYVLALMAPLIISQAQAQAPGSKITLPPPAPGSGVGHSPPGSSSPPSNSNEPGSIQLKVLPLIESVVISPRMFHSGTAGIILNNVKSLNSFTSSVVISAGDKVAVSIRWMNKPNYRYIINCSFSPNADLNYRFWYNDRKSTSATTINSGSSGSVIEVSPVLSGNMEYVSFTVDLNGSDDIIFYSCEVKPFTG